MITLSRFSNNGVAYDHHADPSVAPAPNIDNERQPATNGDEAFVPSDDAERRSTTGDPSLNGVNGEKSANERQPPDPKAYREARGRFVKGHPGGPGNPYRRRVSNLRCAVACAISDKEVATLMRNLLRRAGEDDAAAAKVLLAYVIGKPTPAPDPDMDDIHEWDVKQQSCVTSNAFEQMLHSLPAHLANDLVNTAWPVILADFNKALVARVTNPPPPPELKPAPGLRVPTE